MHATPAAAVLILGMFVLCGLVWLAEQEYRDRAFANMLHKYFGLRPLEKICIALFVIVFCQRGGSKPTNGVPESGGGSVTNSVVIVNPDGGTGSGLLTGGGTGIVSGGSVSNSVAIGDAAGGIGEGTGGTGMLFGETYGPPRLTTNQYAAGFALVRAVTNAAPWPAAPANAVVHAPWTRYGVAEDTFWLPTNGWAFVLGTNAADGVHVSSSGTLSFGCPKGSPRACAMPDGTNISFFAPLQAPIGTVPPGGRFWHAVTPSNSLLCAWQDVFAGRDSNSVVSFQAELFWNGDFAYRYAFTNAPALTNFAVGAQNRGGGETYALNEAGRLVNGLELRWRAFGVLDPGVDDHDGDGITTYDEVMLFGSDPSKPDSDFDGLGDLDELVAGTKILNPDSDGDGLADGIDPDPLLWNDTGAVIPGSGGLTSGYVILNGLDPDTNWTLDSDNDGWPDWKEALAGTSPTDPYSTPQNSDSSCKIFDATITLAADLPCPVVLKVGDFTLVLLKAGSWTLTLKEGVAYDITLTASQPCAVNLSCSLTSAYAALQSAGGAFSGDTQLPGGVPVASGVIAQPTLAVLPTGLVCFHSEDPKTVAAQVTPAIAGSYQWYWYGGPISATGGKSANISWDGGDSYVEVRFTADGATQPRCAYHDVTKCSRVDDDTWCDKHGCEHWYCACDDYGAEGDDDCGFHGQKVSECLAAICPTHNCHYSECPEDWCHEHDCLYTECYDQHYHSDDHGDDPSGSGGGGGPGSEDPPETPPETPPTGNMETSGWMLLNDDDDNADGSDDRYDESPAADQDLRPIWPMGSYSGACCPCPEHRGAEGWRAKLTSCSDGLRVFHDSSKSSGVSVGDLFYPGECVYVEGYAASSAVSSDSLHWELKNPDDEDAGTYELANKFSVLSLRLTGDYTLDGTVDGNDRAAAPSLSETYGWGLPAAPNVFKLVRLSTESHLDGTYTLSLEGDAGAFRIWTTDSPASTNSPLLICGQAVANGVGGAAFAGYPGCDLYVEAVSNGAATLTYRYEGTGGAAGISCEASLKMTAWSIEFVHAEGDEVGQPMDELPIFTPCSGTGKGVPIYDSPDPDLTVAFSAVLNTNGTRSAELTYLGGQYAVTETAPDSLFFTNISISASFSNTVLADTNVEEALTATLTLPSLGITNAVYFCTETDAASLVFKNGPHGIVASLSGLSASVPDTMNIQVSSLYSSRSWALTETAPDSRCFTGSGLALKLAGSPALTSGADTLLLSLSDEWGLTNTVFTVLETGGQTLTFRNYDPPVSTDSADVPVPDFAPWRLKIPGIANSALISSVALTTAVDRVDQITFSASGNDLLSDQKIILTPNRTFDAEIPSGYSPLRIDDIASRWQDSAAHGVGVEVSLYALASPVKKTKKEKPGAVVLQSLDWGSSVGQGLDPENRIRQPLLEMGYSAVKDYKASVSQTLSDYVKGKQVWYSMSHGGTENGTPYTAFNGLLFRDGPIRASNLEPLDLNYKLAIVDGCCSAQTVLTSEQDARNSNTLSPSCQNFADSFGPDSAYMGWSWKMEPNSAQTWSGEFVNNLKFDAIKIRGLTVLEAHDRFLKNHSNENDPQKYAPAARNMKIYGSTDNIIDARKAGEQ